MITRLNILLAVVLFFSCLWLVRSSYESRRLFVELEKAQSQSHELQIDYERLEVDKRAQATPLRVEKLAREKLRMFNNTPGVTHYVSTSASAVSASSGSSSMEGASSNDAAGAGAGAGAGAANAASAGAHADIAASAGGGAAQGARP